MFRILISILLYSGHAASPPEEFDFEYIVDQSAVGKRAAHMREVESFEDDYGFFVDFVDPHVIKATKKKLRRGTKFARDLHQAVSFTTTTTRTPSDIYMTKLFSPSCC